MQVLRVTNKSGAKVAATLNYDESHNFGLFYVSNDTCFATGAARASYGRIVVAVNEVDDSFDAVAVERELTTLLNSVART